MIALVLSAVSALVYLYVGRLFLQRSVRETHRIGLLSFATWWFSLAAYTLILSTSRALNLLGVEQVFIYRALSWIGLLPLTLALGGLVAYLLYLSTGNPRVVRWVAVAYTGMYLLFAFLVAYLHPVGVEVVDGQSRVVYENQLPPAMGYVLIVGLLAPGILGIISYGRLFFRLKDPTSRYRIGLVSTSLLVWFMSSLLVSTLGFADTPQWRIASQAIALGASLMVLAAYRPPRWVQERYGIEPPPTRGREPARTWR